MDEQLQVGLIEQVIKPRRGFVPIDFNELWRYRELFWFLALRDVIIRYKQTVMESLGRCFSRY